MAAPAPQIPSKTRKRLTWKHWFGLAAILLVVLAINAYLLMRATPSWYTPLDPTALSTIDLAERAQENIELHRGVALHNALENVMNGEQPWTLDQDEINALIAIKSNSLPVTMPMVIFTPGKITLAARSKRIPGNDPRGGVGSIVFVVKTAPAANPAAQPTAQIKIHSAWLGCLPVPKSLVESRIPSLTPAAIAAVQHEMALQFGAKSKAIPEAEARLRAVLNGEPFPSQFTYRERRQIIVKDVRVEDGSLTVVFASPNRTGVSPRPAPPLPQSTVIPQRRP